MPLLIAVHNGVDGRERHFHDGVDLFRPLPGLVEAANMVAVADGPAGRHQDDEVRPNEKKCIRNLATPI